MSTLFNVVGAQALKRVKALNWQGYHMSGAKRTNGDTAIYQCDGKRIFLESLNSGQQKKVFDSPFTIIDFDINEKAGQLCYLTDASRLHIYDYKIHKQLATIPILGNLVQFHTTFSPSGKQILLYRQVKNMYPSLDSNRWQRAIGRDTLSLINVKSGAKSTLSFEGQVCDAAFYNDETLVVSLLQKERIQIVAVDLKSSSKKGLVTCSSYGLTFTIHPTNGSLIIACSNYVRTYQQVHGEWVLLSTARSTGLGWTNTPIEFVDTTGHYLYLLGGKNLQLWAPASKAPEREYLFENRDHRNGNQPKIIRKIGELLAIIFEYGETDLYSFKTFQASPAKILDQPSIQIQRLGSGRIDNMSYSPKTSVFTFRDETGTIIIYNLAIRKKIGEIETGSSAFPYAIHPLGEDILYTGDAALISFNYKTGRQKELYTGYLHDFSISPDGSRVAISPSSDSIISVVDYNTGRTLRTCKIPLQKDESATRIYFDTKGENLFATTFWNEPDLAIGEANKARTAKYSYRLFWARPNDTVFAAFGRSDQFPYLAFSPNGSNVATTDYTNKLIVYTIQNGNEIKIAEIICDGCKQPTSKGERNLESRYNQLGPTFFFDDSIVGIPSHQREICRYNIKQKSFLLPLVNKEGSSASQVGYPAQGAYYFQLNLNNRIEVRTKYNDATAFTIQNEYMDVHGMKFYRDKLFINVGERLELFDLKNLSIDTTYTNSLPNSPFNSWQIEPATGSLIIASWRELKAIRLEPTSLKQGNHFNFDQTFLEASTEAFQADTKNGHVAIIGYQDWQSFGLQICDFRDTLRKLILFRHDYKDAQFEKLLYDQKQQTYYIISRGNQGYELTSFEVDMSRDRINTNNIIIPTTHLSGAYVDTARQRLYLLLNNSGTFGLTEINTADLSRHELISFNNQPTSLAIDTVRPLLFIGDERGYLHVHNLLTRVTTSYPAHEGALTFVSLSGDGKLITKGSEGALKYWLTDPIQLIGSLHFVGEKDFIFIDKDGYYQSTKNGVKAVAYKLGTTIIPVEQLDLQFNRPDLVLKALDSTGNKKMIQLYEMALRKRSGTSQLPRIENFTHVNRPTVRLIDTGATVYSTSQQKLELSFAVQDTFHLLQQVQIWINDVPHFLENGLQVRYLGTKKKTFKVLLLLNEGQNKIEVSATNSKNIESVRVLRWITYTPPIGKHYVSKVYLFTIAVNKYQKPRYNLNYAINDGRQLTRFFKDNIPRQQFITDSFYNQRATKETIQSIRSQLMKTHVDDKVILHFSGHGTVDTNRFEFYFGSHDIDFERPWKRGISYRQIEGLLRGIPARKKLILIDACHSGLYDKNSKLSAQKSDTIEVNGAEVVIRNAGRVGGTASELDRKSFELMQEVFWNTQKGDGTFVIAASAGDSYAIESSSLNNGVFTYSLLNLLRTIKSKNLTIKRLAELLAIEVKQLTKEKQKPQLRKEYLDIDWKLIE